MLLVGTLAWEWRPYAAQVTFPKAFGDCWYVVFDIWWSDLKVVKGHPCTRFKKLFFFSSFFCNSSAVLLCLCTSCSCRRLLLLRCYFGILWGFGPSRLSKHCTHLRFPGFVWFRVVLRHCATAFVVSVEGCNTLCGPTWPWSRHGPWIGRARCRDCERTSPKCPKSSEIHWNLLRSVIVIVRYSQNLEWVYMGLEV